VRVQGSGGTRVRVQEVRWDKSESAGGQVGQECHGISRGSHPLYGSGKDSHQLRSR
jgi:hypothetical protein